ncbi:unnamed protein product [Vitrella brassicaformis CCMP3155]|uniref:Uncharacterized protein n=2 Tax=Vitrella brassicaformis TaxID=1169539 RepID=A0A0G4GXY9_VITBC|nr:unnamed protein product [Vitrella brassicaformis CCMP3155]|mmetsp:Transcript_42872/g.121505  ORF Transcript_42872/g.121505 Transcript_42872/m.121505 type:complete len:382 (+) Transcript_42872:123-1268(+)|eukprot:CEM35965.1 unnamed protein product [Vitrella brassicaformis CCMP3155]
MAASASSAHTSSSCMSRCPHFLRITTEHGGEDVSDESWGSLIVWVDSSDTNARLFSRSALRVKQIRMEAVPYCSPFAGKIAGVDVFMGDSDRTAMQMETVKVDKLMGMLERKRKDFAIDDAVVLKRDMFYYHAPNERSSTYGVYLPVRNKQEPYNTAYIHQYCPPSVKGLSPVVTEPLPAPLPPSPPHKADKTPSRHPSSHQPVSMHEKGEGRTDMMDVDELGGDVLMGMGMGAGHFMSADTSNRTSAHGKKRHSQHPRPSGQASHPRATGQPGTTNHRMSTGGVGMTTPSRLPPLAQARQHRRDSGMAVDSKKRPSVEVVSVDDDAFDAYVPQKVDVVVEKDTSTGLPFMGGGRSSKRLRGERMVHIELGDHGNIYAQRR